VHQPPDSETSSDQPVQGTEDVLADRVEALSAWITEIDTRVHATVAVTGDRKTARDLRRAIEALSKRDPKFEDRLTHEVEVVADRLTTLGKTINTTAAALAAKDGQIATLRRELQEGNVRIEAVVAELRRTVDATNADELRRTIAALSDERTPPKGADRRLDGLSGKVDVFAQRLDTLAGTVATTAAGLAGREGELAALRRKLEDDSTRVETAIEELRTSVDPTPVLELRQAVKTLSDETSALKRSSRRGLDGVSSRVDTLAGHLDSLAKTAGITATDLAERERESAALRASFDEENARLDSVVVKLQQALGALSSQVAALEGVADRDTVVALDGRVDGLGGTVDALGARLDALASTVETTAKADVGNEVEVAALTRRFEAASSRVETLVGDLRTALETMPEPRLDPELETRFGDLEQDVHGLASQLEQVEAATSTTWKVAAAASADVELHLAEVARQLEALEQGRAVVAAEAARVSEAWTEERAWVREQLEALGSHSDVRPALAELTARLDEIERDRELPANTEAAPHVGEEAERGLAELAGRLDAMERDREAVAAEIARVWQTWASDRSSLQSGLDTVATRLVEVASAVSSGTSEPASWEREVGRLRVLVDGLQMRLASGEKELAALAGSLDVGARLDELMWRLDSLESSAGSGTAPGSSLPVPGEGRFRLELRGLELRMEHAEAAARENREAVLMQLERLASRIEWRLQRLEADEAGAAYLPAGGVGPMGQVVPIHGTDT